MDLLLLLSAGFRQCLGMDTISLRSISTCRTEDNKGQDKGRSLAWLRVVFLFA